MLRRQDFSWRKQRHLISVLDRDNRRFRRNQSFPAAHIALQQPVHRVRRCHVRRDLA